MVSHEIRTPLNGILGHVGAPARHAAAAASRRAYAKAVKTSGDTLLSLIEEILDFSKIEAGRLDLEARPFWLGAMVEEIVELLAPRAQAKGLEIASSIDERLAGRVVGDMARLRQVLLNLAGNAVKFTETGGVALIVEPGEQPDEVSFAVRDTGIGIAPDAQARIFEEFEQADGGMTRKFGGTGLGLAISRRIVERMGGSLALQSAPGEGSIFGFTVALPRAADASDAASTAPDLSGTAILIVAPTAIEAPLVAQRLERWGAKTCLVANDGDRARGAARAALGRAADRSRARARSRERASCVTPHRCRAASCWSRRPSATSLARFRQAGFTGYLVKPVRAASLAARFGSADADDDGSTTGAAKTARRPRRKRPRDPGRRGQRHQRAARARAARTSSATGRRWRATAPPRSRPFSAPRAPARRTTCVLMDVHMPEIDGIEATRRIRAAEAASGARARRSSRSPPMRSARIATPASRPAWTISW